MEQNRPIVNLVISQAALKMIGIIKSDERLYPPKDPPQVLGLAWGLHTDHQGNAQGEGVVVGFYTKSQVANFKGSFQYISNLPIVIGGTEQDAERFSGKVLDFEEGRWFFLR